MKTAVLIGIVSAAVLAAACGQFQAAGVGPSRVTTAGVQAIVVDGDAPTDAPTFGAYQTTVDILDREYIDSCGQAPSGTAPVEEDGVPTTRACSQVNAWYTGCTTDPLHFVCDDLSDYPNVIITRTTS